MKNILLLATISLAFFTGCSKKMPIALPATHTPINQPTINEENMNPSLNSNSNFINGNSSNISKNSFEKGAINSAGKYTGKDGISKSGIKIVYFATDSYTLDDDQIERLMNDIPKIKRLVETGKIIAEGNCDEFGTDEYNYALGLKRAKSVKKLLINAGIPAQKIDTVSYGESNPICTINAPACHAKNRRVEINRI